MINKFFEIFYPKIFINIVVEAMHTQIYVEVLSKNKLINSINKSFDTTAIDSRIETFLYEYTKESPFYYISLLDKSSQQGAVPTCLTNKMQGYCDTTSIQYKCYNNSWAFYTSEYDLEAIKHEYRNIGLDFIFSPFVVLAKFFKDKIEVTRAMFILIEEGYISFTIFDHSKLLYASYLDMDYDKEDNLAIEHPLEDTNPLQGLDGINLEDIELDGGIEKLDDFSVIEDLDISSEIDEFSDDKEEISKVLAKTKAPSMENFGEDYQRFSIIQNSLNKFYNDPKYKSEFIENIYIADAIGVSPDLKSYLEEEMFLNVYIRKIDLPMALCDIAKVEANEL